MQMKKIRIIFTILLAMIFCGACGSPQEPVERVNVEPQTSQMKAICELATLECYYHNVAKYMEEDAEGFLLWKKDKRFWVEYSGVVVIGIDASRLKVEVEGTQVTISMPKAMVLSVKVDPESLTEDSFYVDKDSAAISAQDATNAYKEAQDYMKIQAAGDSALLAGAQQRAQTLLEEYVNNIGEAMGVEYSIKWVYLE